MLFAPISHILVATIKVRALLVPATRHREWLTVPKIQVEAWDGVSGSPRPRVSTNDDETETPNSPETAHLRASDSTDILVPFTTAGHVLVLLASSGT